ncbi:unnamed protein product [Closterium sp. NIES-65]|nr:unnamed protein product [Closterium sp. NIES-65]
MEERKRRQEKERKERERDERKAREGGSALPSSLSNGQFKADADLRLKRPISRQLFCDGLQDGDGVWRPGPKGSCRPQPQQAKRRLQMDADVDSRSDERPAKVQRSYVLQQVGQQRGQAGRTRGEEAAGGQTGAREQAVETGPGSKQAGVGHGGAWACEHDAGKSHGRGVGGNECVAEVGEGGAASRCGGGGDAARHGQDGRHYCITPRSRIGACPVAIHISRDLLSSLYPPPPLLPFSFSQLLALLFLRPTTSLLNSRIDAINMCYVNATLQALASLPPFLSHLLHLPLPASLARSSSLRLPVTTELQRLTWQLLGLPHGNSSGATVGSISSRLRGTAGGVADARAVKRAVGRSAPIFQGQEQQDAHEFLCALLHCLASEAATIAAAAASPAHARTPTLAHAPAHTHMPTPVEGWTGGGKEGGLGNEEEGGGEREEKDGGGDERVEKASTGDGNGCAVGSNFLSTEPTASRGNPQGSTTIPPPPSCQPPAAPSPSIAQHTRPLASRPPRNPSPPFPQENPFSVPRATAPPSAPSGKAPHATTDPASSRSPSSPLVPAAGAPSVNPFSLAKAAGRPVVLKEVAPKGVVCGLKGGGRLITRVSMVGGDAEGMDTGESMEGQLADRRNMKLEGREAEHIAGQWEEGEARECGEVEEDWAELLEGAAGVLGEDAGDAGDDSPVSVMVDGGKESSSGVGGGGGMEETEANRGRYECRKNVDRVEIATTLDVGEWCHMGITMPRYCSISGHCLRLHPLVLP